MLHFSIPSWQICYNFLCQEQSFFIVHIFHIFTFLIWSSSSASAARFSQAGGRVAILSRCQQHQQFSRNTPTPITQMIFGTQSRADAEKKLPQGLAQKALEFYCDDRKSLLFPYTGATSAPAHIFPLFFCKKSRLLLASAAKIVLGLSLLYSETKT